MRRRSFLLGCGCMAFAAAAGVCADEYDYEMPPRFSRADPSSDEGSLWAFMDREEQRLKRSSFLVRDPALHDYVNRIACRLAGEHCPEMRVYLVRTPYFNASMAPNGMMQVWSGLLVRMQNEAQLAAVLGHEIAHYLQRHSVERLRDFKSRTSFAQVVGIALGVAGAGNVGALAQLGILASGLAYGRDQEREADRIGIALLARNGYAPAEAGRIWGQLLEEYEGAKAAGDEVSTPNILFASHPPAEERREVLATAAKRDWPGAERTGADEYRVALAPHRMGFLQDEVRRRRFGESLVLFDRLLKSSPRDGQVQFVKGEAYRLRGRDGDAKLALAAYRASLDMDGTPPEVHRSLGTVLRQTGEDAEAMRAFQRYLELRPDAEDAELIRSYLTRSES